MKTLFSLCLVGLIIAPLLPLASAHGVCTGLPPRFGRLDDVHFSSQTVQTGDTIVITGNITMMTQQDLHGYLSIHSSPSPHARWAIVSTEPNEKMINVTQFSKIPFSITVKALQPGTYKLSPILYVPDIGPAFSMLTGCNTEPVVKVTGEPICNAGFVPILKAEDGSSFCVKPDTVQILVERGWAEPITSGISQTSNTLPKGAQVDLTNISVWTCGAGTKIATFVDTSGFANITKANEPNKGLPVDWNDFFDFVIKPNSTGYINMSFEFSGENYGIDNKQYNGSIQSSIGLLSSYGTISNAFNKTAIYTLDDPNVPHTSNLNGIHVFATNAENVTNHTLKLTYVIKVDSSAKEGTYGIDIPYTCPLELLTVGDHQYTGSIPWHRGIY